MNYVVIMAGGTGTRLWPASREENPKQLHSLITKNSLLQDTVNDVKDLIPEDNILIVTGKKYENSIKKQLPNVKHYLFEPYKLGKTLAIGLSALYLSKLDSEATMVLLWADSYIGNKAEFIKVLGQAVKYAKNGQNLIIRVKPAYPATCYGYIEVGKNLDENLYNLKSFKEKPNYNTATNYCSSSNYVWNPGISVWRVDKLLELYKQFVPEYYKVIMQFESNILDAGIVNKFDTIFKNFEKTEIEDTIYPKAENLGVMPADIGWNDIGNWGAIYGILAKEKDENIIKGNHIGIDNKSILVHSKDRLIVTIGLENIAIIDTPDVTLVCQKDKAQDIKKIVEKLKEEGREEYL